MAVPDELLSVVIMRKEVKRFRAFDIPNVSTQLYRDRLCDNVTVYATMSPSARDLLKVGYYNCVNVASNGIASYGSPEGTSAPPFFLLSGQQTFRLIKNY